MPLIQSPLAFTLPWYDTWIPKGFWQEWVVPKGKILSNHNPTMPWITVDGEYINMIAYSPKPGSVKYTGDVFFPQFSEIGYSGQCVAFAKAVSDRRSTPSREWKPWISLPDFVKKPESKVLSQYQWMMIACFDGKTDYAQALASRKHVAILLKINYDAKWKPISIVVVDQNYYSFAPYTFYTGKIAKHTIDWWKSGQTWVSYAQNYHIVTI